MFENLWWLLHHKLRNVLEYSRWYFLFVNRIKKGYLYNWKMFPRNAGLYWSSRRPESVLLQIFQRMYWFCYFKGLDIWIAFVVNKSMVRIELFWTITQRVVVTPYWWLRIKNVYVLILLFVYQDIQYLEAHHIFSYLLCLHWMMTMFCSMQ